VSRSPEWGGEEEIRVGQQVQAETTSQDYALRGNSVRAMWWGDKKWRSPGKGSTMGKVLKSKKVGEHPTRLKEIANCPEVLPPVKIFKQEDALLRKRCDRGQTHRLG